MSIPAFLLPVVPVVLLCLSNIFMMFAWYGHLKFTHAALWMVILASWGIALFEYCLAVPANRLGIQYYSLADLRTIQVVISLTVFIGFAILFMGEKITLYHLLGFLLIAAGAAVIFHAPKWAGSV